MADKTVEEMKQAIFERFCIRCNMPISCNMNPRAEVCFLNYAPPAEIRAKYAEMNGGERDE